MTISNQTKRKIINQQNGKIYTDLLQVGKNISPSPLNKNSILDVQVHNNFTMKDYLTNKSRERRSKWL
jgi:hypothetical protein